MEKNIEEIRTENIEIIENGLSGGVWQLDHEPREQYLQFFKPTDNNRTGKLLIADSSDFKNGKRELEYMVIWLDDTRAFIDIIAPTANLKTQYKLHHLNSYVGALHLDAPNGFYIHYSRPPRGTQQERK